MAEIIGVVASGISIVQLGGQIAQSFVKIKGYWDEIKDAPDEVMSLLADMEILQTILVDFAEEQSLSRLPDIVFNNRIFDQSLLLCNEAAEELAQVAESMSSQMLSKARFSKQCGALRLVLKQGYIKRCKSRLKRALSLLTLSHQAYTRAVFRLQLEALSGAKNSFIVDDLGCGSPTLSTTVEESSGKKSNSADTYSKPPNKGLSTLEENIDSEMSFESAAAIFGSLSFAQRHRHRSQLTQSKNMAKYRVPVWLGCKAWQLTCDSSQLGWSLSLSTHNVVPSTSRQLQYAKFGCLSKLQGMIVNKEASLFDETAQGNSILSIAALGGQVDTCRWLLQQGARTDHFRFGSILNQILHYGGSLSFPLGTSLLQVVELLQNKEGRDILDQSDNTEENCAFYGTREVLVWLLEQSRFLGNKHSVEEKSQLAINIARNTDQNGSELVRAVLNDVEASSALQAQNSVGITLLHRIASRIGGTFAYENQGLRNPCDATSLASSCVPLQCHSELFKNARDSWRLLLVDLEPSESSLNRVATLKNGTQLTPILMGIRTLIYLWVGSSSRLFATLSTFLQRWLIDLGDLGLDLLDYGEVEKQLRKEPLLCKDFHRRQVQPKKQRYNRYTESINTSQGGIRLVNFMPSKNARNWQFWWSEPTDEFAGQFWAMQERRPATIPGSWEEECN